MTDSAIEGPADMDSGLPNPDPTGGGTGGPGGPEGGTQPFPTADSALPVPMLDASGPPPAQDAGRDTSTPPPPPVVDAAPPPPVDAAPDVSAPPPPPPDASMPPPSGNTCATTPSYPTPDACSKCICSSCASQVQTCYGGTNAALCKAVRDCAIANRCTSTACFCGSSPTCLFPDGPCMAEIQAAAGTDDLVQIQTASEDPSTPVGASNAVGTCQMASCASQCGL